jgi:hypothetical protein
MAIVLDPDNLDEPAIGPRTYALKIEVTDRYGVVATFYKFGYSSLSVKRRYAKDSGDLKITIQKIWRHATIADAKAHEERLFNRYRPTCLFNNHPLLGRTNGILLQGGNTELFLADRLNGERNVKLDYAVMWTDYTFSGHLRFSWQFLPPSMSIYSGGSSPRWLEWLTHVPDGYMLLPEESGLKGRLIFAREYYLFHAEDFAASNKKREAYQDQAVWCTTFAEALRRARCG